MSITAARAMQTEIVRQVSFLEWSESGQYVLASENIRYSGIGSLSKVMDLITDLCRRLGREGDWYYSNFYREIDEGNVLTFRCPRGYVSVETFAIYYSASGSSPTPYLGVSRDDCIETALS